MVVVHKARSVAIHSSQFPASVGIGVHVARQVVVLFARPALVHDELVVAVALFAGPVAAVFFA